MLNRTHHNDQSNTFDCVVVGGGFFGIMVALHFARRGQKTLLLEKRAGLIQRASANNQARIHVGYHYPRSFLTASRSRELQKRFIADFPGCVSHSFRSLYGIARKGSHVSADFFEKFSKRIGASLHDVPDDLKGFLSADEIEGQWLTEEKCFDYQRIRMELEQRILTAGVQIRLSSKVDSISTGPRLSVVSDGNVITSKTVVIACYANTNRILAASRLPLIPFRQELVEMALVEVPKPLKEVGITIMDGPFWSLMPYPSLGLHTLSHVRFTPHTKWSESTTTSSTIYTENQDEALINGRTPESSYRWMVQDVRRYLPLAASFIQHSSIWELKTILPKSDQTDSRPILYKPNHGAQGVHVVVGSKIDNVYDLLDEMDRQYAS